METERWNERTHTLLPIPSSHKTAVRGRGMIFRLSLPKHPSVQRIIYITATYVWLRWVESGAHKKLISYGSAALKPVMCLIRYSVSIKKSPFQIKPHNKRQRFSKKEERPLPRKRRAYTHIRPTHFSSCDD